MNKDEFQRAAFEKMLEGNGLSLRELFRMGLSAFLDPFRFIFVLDAWGKRLCSQTHRIQVIV